MCVDEHNNLCFSFFLPACLPLPLCSRGKIGRYVKSATAHNFIDFRRFNISSISCFDVVVGNLQMFLRTIFLMGFPFVWRCLLNVDVPKSLTLGIISYIFSVVCFLCVRNERVCRVSVCVCVLTYSVFSLCGDKYTRDQTRSTNSEQRQTQNNNKKCSSSIVSIT